MTELEFTKKLRAIFPARTGENFSAFDWIHAEGSPILAQLYAKLFWPEFAVFENMVFLKEELEDQSDEARIRQELARQNGDTRATEKGLNQVEIPTLFGARAGESSVEEDILLGQILVDMWSCRLQKLYPDRRFRVVLLEGTGADEGPTIQFYQT